MAQILLRYSTHFPSACAYPLRPALQKRPRYSRKSPTFFRKSPTFFRKAPTFFSKAPTFFSKAPMFQKYVATSLSASPALLTFHLAHNRTLLSAPTCFCWHFPLPSKELTLPLFINISTQSPFLSRFSHAHTRVYRDLHFFSFTTFTDTPYNLL